MIATGENLHGVSGIYCAIHRDTGACYVGSSINIAQRISGHGRSAPGGKPNRFKRALLLFGTDAFDFEVLERCEHSKLIEREGFYIALMNATGANGLNTILNPRAVGYGPRHSEEMKRIMSEKRKGTKQTEAHRQNIAKGLKKYADRMRLVYGKGAHPDACQKISISKKGLQRSESHKANISKGSIGKKLTPQHIANVVAKITGTRRNEETKNKMSLARAKWWAIKKQLN
jgi:group I intron endonuclease